MKILIGIGIYLLIGILGSKFVGFKGLVEILLWPVVVVLMIFLAIRDGYWILDNREVEDVFKKKEDER